MQPIGSQLRWLVGPATVLLACGLLAASLAEARPRSGFEQAASSVAQPSYSAPAQRRGGGGGGISLEEAIRMATQQRPGRVVRAVTNDEGGRRVHEIRILLDEGGRMVTVRIPADGGR